MLPPTIINGLLQLQQSFLLFLHRRLFRDHLQDATVHTSAHKVVELILHLHYSL